ncbi:dihydrodipicolinate synthetase [Alkalidesulfovibrio alkalitolerans DSM 16529]|uniref:Dihydrodipicolinate synthetase n=1 Tax=Alkalidesulfovibrio alkalitolerans DSM 16529 TaxID=1121439 RepID=S7TFN3_9BACT|nr:dihydrodipicolinate synthase family protein [Alkalidesulfovibrio alkalitolerans]EPR35561.1 dihydrodipicolinate synthetase [Alkalidesulfovibrio alkalitolerans DSM 16529]
MIETRPVEGIVPVVVTPFDDHGEVDLTAVERLVGFLNSKSIGGLWVLGTGSEDMNLSYEKRLRIARMACAANAGKTPLILGAGFFAMEDTLAFFEDTKDLACDGYHVMPYHPLLSLERLEWFYTELADRCPRPLWMYTSGNWARPIPPEFVARLKGHPNIAGIKYSNSNAVLAGKVINLAEPGFQVITAVAAQLLASLAMGARAHTSSLGSALPEAMIAVYELFLQGDIQGARAAQRTLVEFLSLTATCAKTDNFLTGAEEKYILSLRGICGPRMSSYYRELTEREQAVVRKALSLYPGIVPV